MDQLKLELKTFERKFEKKYGRPPARDDIRALPDIKYRYKQYATLQRERHKKEVVQETPHRNETTELDLPVELGPTPQIYGKVLGLFDMKVSPIKKESVVSPETSLKISGGVSGVNRSPKLQEVKRRLDFELTPRKSPKKNLYGPNSPFKFDGVQLSIQTPRRNLRSLMAESEMTSGGSPSPIIKRPIGKPLLQLARENEKFMEETDEFSDDEVISREIKDVFQNDEIPQDEQALEDLTDVVFKRTKRKHILRPAVNGSATPQPIQVNIKDEMARLKQQAIDEFNGVETASSAVMQTADKAPTTSTRRKPKKYNLVSNNFRRLKLPKAKNKGKGNRWGQR
ncbi:LAME_0G16776g1_1 [Lachancea meyersii CBS 8951]|uniref:DNA replication regulator SLD2 n=1 Tax=Lachancea meyersii CBS 8951 TaxID=1266667 RepID=A0A1G4KB73_9SACH|nr:LAME_0G16776g1_1 [Lachancea meyersii CBS 8951]